MILLRYLLVEILRPAVLGLVTLMAVYAIYSGAQVLSEAVAGRVAGEVIVQLVLLRTLIAGEVLVPTALYLAVAWAFVRLDRDSELSVLRASGQSITQLLRPVVWTALIGAIVVAVLTVQARPWAYRHSYVLEERLVTADPKSLEPGRFYQVGSRVVLLADRIDAQGLMHNVFAEERRSDGVQVIRADELEVVQDETGERRVMEFRNGTAYLLRKPGEGDMAQVFAVLRYPAALPPARRVQNQRRARSVTELMRSTVPKDVAELQWRLGLPLLTAFIAPLAAVIAIGRPRSPVFPRLILAVAVFVAVFNVAAVARTWVENGAVPSMPGLWWSLALPLLLLFGVLAWRRG